MALLHTPKIAFIRFRYRLKLDDLRRRFLDYLNYQFRAPDTSSPIMEPKWSVQCSKFSVLTTPINNKAQPYQKYQWRTKAINQLEWPICACPVDLPASVTRKSRKDERGRQGRRCSPKRQKLARSVVLTPVIRRKTWDHQTLSGRQTRRAEAADQSDKSACCGDASWLEYGA